MADSPFLAPCLPLGGLGWPPHAWSRIRPCLLQQEHVKKRRIQPQRCRSQPVPSINSLKREIQSSGRRRMKGFADESPSPGLSGVSGRSLFPPSPVASIPSGSQRKLFFSVTSEASLWPRCLPEAKLQEMSQPLLLPWAPGQSPLSLLLAPHPPGAFPSPASSGVSRKGNSTFHYPSVSVENA